MPDSQLWWQELIPALILIVPTALFTGLVCWFLWGRYGSQSRDGAEELFDVEQRAIRASKELNELKEKTRHDARRVHDLEHEIAATDKRQQETLQEVARAKRSLANAMSKMETQRAERDQFELELNELREQGSVASSEQESPEKVIELTEALRESEYQVSRLGTEIQLLRSVRTEFEALRNDNRDLEDESGALRKEKERLDERAVGLMSTAEEAREKQIAAEREILRLKEELVSLRLSDSSPPPVTLFESAPLAETDISFGSVYDMPPSQIDDLTKIDGISPGLETKLNQLGIYQYRQVASWEHAQIEAFSDRLGFQDRIARDQWVEQASALADGPEPVIKEPTVEKPSAAETNKDQEEPSLFFSGFGALAGDKEVPEAAAEEESVVSEPVVAASSSEDADGSIHDPQLGQIYQRPPEQIDDLTRVKGIAKVIEGRLHEIGIFRYRQVALWTAENVEAFSKRLSFKDRIQRDRWREQCQELHREKHGESVEVSALADSSSES